MNYEVLTYIPEALKVSEFNRYGIAPGFTELEELAAIDGITPRVVVVKEGENIEGCAVCFVENRRHHGLHLKVYSLFGYLLHDYSRIYCTNREAYNMLIQGVTDDAESNGCDLISWNNIPAEYLPKDTLLIHSEIKIFSSENCEQGWSRFYKGKHVKYLINKAKKLPDGYRVEIIDGLVSDELMNELSQFHIYRWGFAGSSSPFLTNKVRGLEYRAHPSNKHYLRIMTGDELIACHYGMIYGDTILFHTPVINPKYLELSPMKLILAETAKYCEEKGINDIDFGHGDEAYKDGYCTLPRYTCCYENPLTAKGKLAVLLGKVSRSNTFNSLKKKIFDVRSSLVNLKHKPGILTIESKPGRPSTGIDAKTVFIRNWPDFCDYAKATDLPINKDLYQRYHYDKDAIFVATGKDSKLLASGWLRRIGQVQDESSTTATMHLYDIKYHDSTALENLINVICAQIPLPISVEADGPIKSVLQKL